MVGNSASVEDSSGHGGKRSNGVRPEWREAGSCSSSGPVWIEGETSMASWAKDEGWVVDNRVDSALKGGGGKTG